MKDEPVIIDRRTHSNAAVSDTDLNYGVLAPDEEGYEDLSYRDLAVDEPALVESVILGQPNVTARANLLAPDTVYDSPVPIFNRILVLRQAKEAIWKGTRIIVPDIAQKDTNRGVVVATAESYIVGGVAFPMKDLVRPGDLCFFGPFNMDNIEVDGQVYGLCTIFDVQLIQKAHWAVAKEVS